MCSDKHRSSFTREDSKFAVIIPIYNTDKYLRECLDSLVSQTYENFVAFLIDDGSTDASGQIADQYAAKDSRLRVVHKKNGGVSSARNAALDLLEEDGAFDYLLCLDSDDIWVPNCLETVRRNLPENGDEILFYGTQSFDKNGEIEEPNKTQHPPLHFSREEVFGFAFDNSKPAYTRSPAFSMFIGNIVFPCTLIRGQRFNTGFCIGEDQDYMIRALGKCSGLIAISDYLLKYRLRRNSLSHSEQFITTDPQVISSWLNLIDELPPSAAEVIERKAADTWWNTIRRSANSGVLAEHWNEFCATLQMMEKQFHSNVLHSSKHRKRIRIFKLGRTAVRLYFYMRINKPSSLKKYNYFD